MAEYRLILASRSPRRASLLRQAGFRFKTLSCTVNENDVVDLGPEDHVRILSRRKAEAAQHDVKAGIVIGADTIVYYSGKILGKPENTDDAFRMLSNLSGHTHQVYTGITLLQRGGQIITDVVMTDVVFRTLSEREIRAYVNTGNPMDKAGAYGIQEQAGVFVSEIRGCYFNVVGFPLSRFFEMLHTLWDSDQIERVMFHRPV